MDHFILSLLYWFCPLQYYSTDYNVTPMTPRQFRRFRKNSGNSGKDSGQCCVTQIQFYIASCTPSLILMSTHDRLHSCMLFAHDFHYWKVVDHNHMWRGNVWCLKHFSAHTLLFFFSPHHLGCLVSHLRIHRWLQTCDLFSCVRVQTSECWGLI